ncbi:hypothetical protein LP421_06250 [Rhizobium sp. RCAM05350]|nr:hypothetical protein LP421_06250 [Rhizobium sp. RCAM05350]
MFDAVLDPEISSGMAFPAGSMPMETKRLDSDAAFVAGDRRYEEALLRAEAGGDADLVCPGFARSQRPFGFDLTDQRAVRCDLAGRRLSDGETEVPAGDGLQRQGKDHQDAVEDRRIDNEHDGAPPEMAPRPCRSHEHISGHRIPLTNPSSFGSLGA